MLLQRAAAFSSTAAPSGPGGQVPGKGVSLEMLEEGQMAGRGTFSREMSLIGPPELKTGAVALPLPFCGLTRVTHPL
jgi:hypothetical protein